jgi:hypothetical protein
MSKQTDGKVNRRKFLSDSATGLTGAAIATAILSNDSKAAPETPPRTSIEITRYSMEWNPGKRKGRVLIQTKGTDEPYVIEITSLAEASGYGAILSQRPLVLWSDHSVGAPLQETGSGTKLE